MAALAATFRSVVPADERELRRALWWLLGAALALRLLVAATTAGSLGDLNAFRAVHRSLAADGLDFYSVANPDNGRFAWPYLPGFLPMVELVFAVADATGIAFDRLIRLPAIAADLAIVWIVQWHLGWRGVAAPSRFAAAALVALSPVGVAFTAAHGQIDPVEWLPVVLAVVVWERFPLSRRAIVAGLLVGLAITLKPPAAVAGLALFALGTGLRERVTFACSAALLPVLSMAPFVLADPGGALSILDYQSVPGQGGLSMLLQPDIALARFGGLQGVDSFTAPSRLLQDLAPLLVAVAALGIAALGARAEAEPAALIGALVLTVFVVSPNFLPPYLIWLVPFAVLAGWWRFLLAVYALCLVVLPFKYLPAGLVDRLHLGDARGVFHLELVAAVYIPAGALLWALMAWKIGRWTRTTAWPQA